MWQLLLHWQSALIVVSGMYITLYVQHVDITVVSWQLKKKLPFNRWFYYELGR